VNFTGTDGEVHALEDRLVLHPGMEITDLKQYGSVGANHGVGAGENEIKNRTGAGASTPIRQRG